MHIMPRIVSTETGTQVDRRAVVKLLVGGLILKSVAEPVLKVADRIEGNTPPAAPTPAESLDQTQLDGVLNMANAAGKYTMRQTLGPWVAVEHVEVPLPPPTHTDTASSHTL